MSNESEEETYIESTFIGEISSPVVLDDETDGIDFNLRSLNDVPLELGAAEFITRPGAVYHGVIRAILQQQRPGSDPTRDRGKERHIVVDGLTFIQASRTYRVIQKQEPKILAFIGEVRNPFLLPIITQEFVGLQIYPLQHPDLLYPDGVFQPYGEVQLITSSYQSYQVTIQRAGHPFIDSSRHDKRLVWEITVDGITFEQAQDIRRLLQFVGPPGTLAIGTILGTEQPSQMDKSIDLQVEMLQRG